MSSEQQPPNSPAAPSTAMVLPPQPNLSGLAEAYQRVLQRRTQQSHQAAQEVQKAPDIQPEPTQSPQAAFDARVEQALQKPSSFAHFAARYLVANRTKVMQDVQQNFHHDAATQPIVNDVANFIFDQIIYPNVADQVIYPLTTPIDLNVNQGSYNQALREAISSEGILGNLFNGASPLWEKFVHGDIFSPSFKSWSNTYEYNILKPRVAFLNVINSILYTKILKKEQVSLRSFLDAIKSHLQEKDDKREVLSTTYLRLGSIIFHKLYSKNSEAFMPLTARFNNIGDEATVQYFLTKLISFLSGVGLGGSQNVKTEQSQSINSLPFPTFNEFPGLMRQLEILMIRFGISQKLYNVTNPQKQAHSQPAQPALTPASFFTAMDQHFLQGRVGHQLANYNQASSLPTMREVSRDFLGNFVDAAAKPSRPGLDKIYAAMEPVLQEVYHLYDWMYRLCQMRQIGEVYATSNLPQKAFHGEVLLENVAIEGAKLREMAIEIEAMLRTPGFHADQIYEAALSLGMLLESSNLNSALQKAGEMAETMQQGQQAVRETNEDPLAAAIDALGTQEG